MFTVTVCDRRRPFSSSSNSLLRPRPASCSGDGGTAVPSRWPGPSSAPSFGPTWPGSSHWPCSSPFSYFSATKTGCQGTAGLAKTRLPTLSGAFEAPRERRTRATPWGAFGGKQGMLHQNLSSTSALSRVRGQQERQQSWGEEEVEEPEWV